MLKRAHTSGPEQNNSTGDASSEKLGNTVILVSIDLENFFYEMYRDLLQMLRQSSLNVVTVTTISELEYQIESKPEVLLFTNEAVAKHRRLRSILLSYVQSGGLAILGCLFSSLTGPNEMNRLFNELGLPWKHCDYERITHHITSYGRSLLTEVDESFSAKAVRLSGVDSADQLYSVPPNAKTESHVFPPGLANPASVMSAMARIGNGAVAYTGDVNSEYGNSRLTVALCHLIL